ncbi:MAG: polyprenyl synthetase family protein, partial [Gloeobacteraceae cyanobacterium ES-bin-316]|nr:polyprenyl synthetase family protein [Ferruginibacter sp.]
MALENIQNLLENSLEEVEALLEALLEEIEEVETRKWMQYFMQSKGHRLRPILVLLSYKCFRPLEKEPVELIKLAAAVELLHTASLIHDDVIDEEQIRRSQDSLNSLKGNKVSILIGNVFYLKAFELASQLPHEEYFLSMVKTSMEMCFGEIIQSEKLEEFLDEASYLNIIERKTAKLMAFCCESGALLAGAGEEQVSQMAELGLSLGY